MNIENLIEQYKCKKLGNPASAAILGQIDPAVFASSKAAILDCYSLEDEKYSTKEPVFFDTRRLVAKSKFIKTSRQLYTDADFDGALIGIVEPLVEQVKCYLKNSEPTLIQIATLLPGQKLAWHIDTFLYQQFSNKIHIPLSTNKNAYYDVLVDGVVKRINMTEGSVWNINNLDLHRSINLGTTARSHLIMDFVDSDVLEILEQTGINYFHHRLDSMSAKENLQLTQLVEYSKRLS